MNRQYGVDLLHLGPPRVAIYLMTDVGCVGGGWLSSWLLKRGWTVNAARKAALLVCALGVAPVFMTSTISHLWLATLLIGLAASAHQGFAANLYTLVSDTAPRQAVGSIVGIGGMFIAKLAGYLLEATGEYRLLFLIAASAYLVDLAILRLLNAHLEPMQFEGPRPPG